MDYLKRDHSNNNINPFSKFTMNYLYTQFQSNTTLNNIPKPTYNVKCSDQKLMLYDIIQSKKADYTNKPKQFSVKLKQIKRDLINNTLLEEPNKYILGNKYRLDNMSKGFQEKYIELANSMGNKQIKIPKSSSTINLKTSTPQRTKEKESKVARLKTEILTAIQPNAMYTQL